MVSTGYTDFGEEWAQKNTWRQDEITRDTSIEVLLFDDSVDETDDTSDVGDITTELDDGNYARQTFTVDDVDVSLEFVDGNVRIEASEEFDLTDTTGTFDAYGLVNTFESDVVGTDSDPTPHLLTTATIDNGPFDADQLTDIEILVRGDLD